jgi:hypothetical protein
MSQVTTRIIKITRHEVVIPSPTNWAEVGKALAVIEQRLEAAGKETRWDDTVTVEARDDEIVFYWTESEPARPMAASPIVLRNQATP